MRRLPLVFPTERVRSPRTWPDCEMRRRRISHRRNSPWSPRSESTRPPGCAVGRSKTGGRSSLRRTKAHFCGARPRTSMRRSAGRWSGRHSLTGCLRVVTMRAALLIRRALLKWPSDGTRWRSRNRGQRNDGTRSSGNRDDASGELAQLQGWRRDPQPFTRKSSDLSTSTTPERPLWNLAEPPRRNLCQSPRRSVA
jgi:hypothetical protein